MDSLVQVFRQEVTGLLEELDDVLLDYEENTSQTDLLDSFMRQVHTLKGSSATAGYYQISELAHAMEDTVHAVVDNTIAPVPALFDLLARSIDAIRAELRQSSESTSPSNPIHQLVEDLQIWTQGHQRYPEPQKPTTNKFDFGEYDDLKINFMKSNGYTFFTVSFDISEVDNPEDSTLSRILSLVKETGEFIVSSPALWEEEEIKLSEKLDILIGSKKDQQEIEFIITETGLRLVRVAIYRTDNQTTGLESDTLTLIADRTLRVDMENLDTILRHAGELVSIGAGFREVAERMQLGLGDLTQSKSIVDAANNLNQLASSLQKSVLHARMVPCLRVFRILRRIVRTRSRALGVKVDLRTFGGSLEIDKGIVDFLYEPLGDYIASLVDHAVTEKSGNAGNTAEVLITARSNGGQIIFDVATLLECTVTILQKIDQTIRCAGGRVVKKENPENNLVSFVVPTTQAICSVMLFKSGDETYGITLDDIHETVPLSAGAVETIGGKLVCNFRGRMLYLVNLCEFLGAQKLRPTRNRFALVVRSGGQLFGLTVDELLGKHDIVIKPLSKRFSSIGILNGATALGDGRPALLLNAKAIVETYEKEACIVTSLQ